jgi:hypothetical protein
VQILCTQVLLFFRFRSSTALTQYLRSCYPRKIYRPVRGDTRCRSRRPDGRKLDKHESCVIFGHQNPLRRHSSRVPPRGGAMLTLFGCVLAQIHVVRLPDSILPTQSQRWNLVANKWDGPTGKSGSWFRPKCSSPTIFGGVFELSVALLGRVPHAAYLLALPERASLQSGVVGNSPRHLDF